jgi:hypothetical protein
MAVAAPRSRTVSTRSALALVALVVLGALGLRVADPQRVEWVRT